ncbi:MAG: cupin domain-containing protein [Syntrophobacterales bacterium]|jgi:dTDP-4-dehydrorhamnose 3,5-epimerase-like enzyme|nr:cupin domain-containing protein [Syntrophobacterales bacterium]
MGRNDGEGKGEFAQIIHGEVARHLAFFELKKEHTRGSHYHALKDETFYVIDGVMRGICIDIDSGERAEYTVRKGDKMHIHPRCAHIFYGMEDALVVEYSPQAYDKRCIPSRIRFDDIIKEEYGGDKECD